MLYKLAAVLATFITIPFMVSYLGAEKFGVWATMLTLISWVMLFDFGIGSGLKNKITESLGKNERKAAASYISTSYAVIGGISVLLFFFFSLAAYWAPWQRVFNTKTISESTLRTAVITLSFFVFLNFWISLVNQIYHGIQKSSIVVLGQFFSNTLALILVYLLHSFAEPSLIYIVIAYGVSLVTANAALSVFLFRRHKDFLPSPALFKKNQIEPLLSLGLKFFVIQFAVILIFMTDKILISQLLGPASVTPYEIVFKLFSVFTVFHSIVLTPLWPAYSDAYTKNDMVWIRKQLKRQIFIAIAIFFGAFVLVILGPTLIKIWIGDDIHISYLMYIFFGIFICVSVWSNVFAYFVNAIGRLNVQLSTAIIAALLNVPLSIIFVKVYGMGSEGILLATIISLSIYAVVGPIDVYRITRARRINE